MDIKLKIESLNNTLAAMENSVFSIDEAIKNVYNATMTLNSDNWNAPEKQVIEQEYIPYLKEISTISIESLKERIAFAKEAVSKYAELDAANAKNANSLNENI